MSIINTHVMSDEVIIPVYIEQYTFVGMRILLEQIGQVREDFNEGLSFLGYLVTQYQNKEVNHQGIEELGSRKIPQ